MFFGLENGVTTKGSCSLVLYYDYMKSITKNAQLLSPIGYLDSIYPKSFHNMTTITIHLNYTKEL